MQIDELKVTVGEVCEGYFNDDEEGVVGYDERLDIRPKYQREFVYKDAQRDEVIRTVLKGLPLNVIYWCKVKKEDGSDGFEVLEVAKGSWIEAIFAKVKPESEKPRMKFNSYNSDEDEDEDADVVIEDNYNKPDEDDVEIEGPNDDDITEDNYSTMMDLGSGDPDEEAENLSDYGDE